MYCPATNMQWRLDGETGPCLWCRREYVEGEDVWAVPPIYTERRYVPTKAGAKFRAKLQVRVVQGPVWKGPREWKSGYCCDGCLTAAFNYHEREVVCLRISKEQLRIMRSAFRQKIQVNLVPSRLPKRVSELAKTFHGLCLP